MTRYELLEQRATISIEEAKRWGTALVPSSRIITTERMIEDQKKWNDAEPAKNMDFTTAPFWRWTLDDPRPNPVYGVNCLVEFLRSFGDIAKEVELFIAN